MSGSPVPPADVSRMWGGRFAAGPAAVMEAINVSIDFDRRLIDQDIAASQAHAAMLAPPGHHIASRRRRHRCRPEIGSGRGGSRDAAVAPRARGRAHERRGTAGGADRRAGGHGCIRRDRATIRWPPTSGCGFATPSTTLDRGITGAAGGADRPGRGACATRSCRASPTCKRRSRSPSATTCSPMSRCSAATAAASPTARRRLNECPLGSAALAGTSFPIDRRMTAEALEFDRPCANSLDAVSDRDFALEFLAPRRSWRSTCRASAKRSCCGVRSRSPSSASPMRSRPAVRSCRRSAIPTPPN